MTHYLTKTAVCLGLEKVNGQEHRSGLYKNVFPTVTPI